jgi:hypothetical protein
MTKSIENLFSILHYGSGALVLITFSLFIKSLFKEKGIFLLIIYTASDIFLNLFNSYITGKWSLYIWSTFTFVEYSIFTYIIWLNIKKPIIRRLIIIASILFIVFTTIYNIITNFKSIDSLPIGIESILIFLYSFYYLYEQMNDTNNLFIYSKYQFWLIIGILIYLAGCFFIYIYANALDEKVLNEYWPFTNVFYAIMNIMFAIGFFIQYRKSKQHFSPKLHPYLN